MVAPFIVNIHWISFLVEAYNGGFKMTSQHIDSKWFNRRQFLKMAGCGTLGLMAGGIMPVSARSASGSDTAGVSEVGFAPDLDITMRSQADTVTLLPGSATHIWRYRAEVNKGDRNRVINLPGSYLGPIIKANRGEKIRIRFTNDIPEESIIHWHGLHVPAIMDGHPRYVVSQGQSYLYEFEVKNRAGTYWYHPHPHGRTGPQVYGGLAGLFLVSDKEEQSLGLPDGENDIPLVLQDRTFDRDNQLVYVSGHHMARMIGFLGDMMIINGQPDYTLSVATSSYRLRLLNGSNARIYRLAWQDGRPITIIGSDGGLLDKPVTREDLFLAPGERVEIWTDFSDRPVGYETAMVSLPFDPGGMGAGNQRGGMMMGGGSRANHKLPIGSNFSVFKVKTTRTGKKSRPLPPTLAQIDSPNSNKADNVNQPRRFHLSMGHMQWTINGRVFQMDDVADNEIVQLGATEIWEFSNTGGGMMPMMDMPHPIHLHGKQFRVLARSGVRHNSYVDDGWKDTVLLLPGEKIRMMVNFDDYSGLFLYHCHNLEHEDMGMMRNYYVRGESTT